MSRLPEIDRIAQAMFEGACKRNKTEKPRYYLGMSSIGDPCTRKLWLGFRGFSPLPIEGRSLRIFQAGHDVERRVLSDLSWAGYRVEDAQTEFSDFGGHFRGHCDGVIHGVTERPHILEIKSANAKKFSSFQRSGIRATNPTYYAQVQCYMGYADLDRALFVVDCKDNSDIYTERVNYDKFEFKALQDKARIIIFAEFPDDPPFPENAAICQWCDLKNWCREPQEAIMCGPAEHCGNCFYFGFVWEETYCHHPQHPLKIRKRGIKCPQWVNFYTQNVIPYRVNKDALRIEQD